MYCAYHDIACIDSIQACINVVLIIPLEPLAPKIAFINCTLNDSITFNWTHNQRDCYCNNTIFNVSWTNINSSLESFSNVTNEPNYIIQNVLQNGNYSITVQSQVQNVRSASDSQNVTTGKSKFIFAVPARKFVIKSQIMLCVNESGSTCFVYKLCMHIDTYYPCC